MLHSCLVALMLFFAPAVGVAGQALDPPSGSPYFKTFAQGDFRVEAGFFPDRPEYVWGEPIYYITYLVRNIGDKPFSFLEGGDYRGGRSESYRITAVDAAGKTSPCRKCTTWAAWRTSGGWGLARFSAR